MPTPAIPEVNNIVTETFINFQVRSRAQNVLFTALGTYNFCCRDLIPHVLKFLNPGNSSVTQQQFKVWRFSLACLCRDLKRRSSRELSKVLNVLCMSPGCLVLSSGESQWSVPGQLARLGVHCSDVARHCTLWPQLSHVSGEALHCAAVWWPRWQNPSPVWDHRHRLLCKKNAKNAFTVWSSNERQLWYLPTC